MLLRRNPLPWARGRLRRELDPRWLPGLGLYLDAYDVNSLNYLQGVSAWNDWSGANRHASQGTGGNQPRMLPWDGRNYGHLPGVAGNWFSTPSIAGLSGPSSLDLRVKVAAVSYTPASRGTLVGQYTGTGNQRSWLWQINTNGTLRFLMSADGTAGPLTDIVSTASVGLSANAETWLRVTWTTPSGLVRFYTSSDGVAWAQLGTDLTGRTSAPFAATTAVGVGSTDPAGAEVFNGRIFYASAASSIDGPAVATFDPSRAHANSNTWVSATGETWTVNRSGANPARIVSAPALLWDGTDDFMSFSGLPAFGTGNFTVLAVAAPSVLDASRNLLSGGDNAFGFRGRPSERLGTTLVGIVDNAESPVGYFPINQQTVVGYRRSGTQGRYLSNTLTNNITDSRNYSGTNTTIGATGILASFFAGTYSNLIVFMRALSDAEFRGVSRYLAARANAGIVIP